MLAPRTALRVIERARGRNARTVEDGGYFTLLIIARIRCKARSAQVLSDDVVRLATLATLDSEACGSETRGPMTDPHAAHAAREEEEPQSPPWLPALGLALFIAAAVVWNVCAASSGSPKETSPESAGSGAPSAPAAPAH
jgi:hypothetical protein